MSSILSETQLRNGVLILPRKIFGPSDSETRKVSIRFPKLWEMPNVKELLLDIAKENEALKECVEYLLRKPYLKPEQRIKLQQGFDENILTEVFSDEATDRAITDDDFFPYMNAERRKQLISSSSCTACVQTYVDIFFLPALVDLSFAIPGFETRFVKGKGIHIAIAPDISALHYPPFLHTPRPDIRLETKDRWPLLIAEVDSDVNGRDVDRMLVQVLFFCKATLAMTGKSYVLPALYFGRDEEMVVYLVSWIEGKGGGVCYEHSCTMSSPEGILEGLNFIYNIGDILRWNNSTCNLASSGTHRKVVALLRAYKARGKSAITTFTKHARSEDHNSTTATAAKEAHSEDYNSATSTVAKEALSEGLIEEITAETTAKNLSQPFQDISDLTRKRDDDEDEDQGSGKPGPSTGVGRNHPYDTRSRRISQRPPAKRAKQDSKGSSNAGQRHTVRRPRALQEHELLQQLHHLGLQPVAPVLQRMLSSGITILANEDKVFGLKYATIDEHHVHAYLNRRNPRSPHIIPMTAHAPMRPRSSDDFCAIVTPLCVPLPMVLDSDLHKHAVSLMVQLVDGIKYLHEHGVAHLDIRPHNLVHDCWTLKIIDFGLSQFLNEPVFPLTILQSSNWVAPEISTGIQFDSVAADIWGTGKTLEKYEPFYEGALGLRLRDLAKAITISDPEARLSAWNTLTKDWDSVAGELV